jgi:hypothetical protein
MAQRGFFVRFTHREIMIDDAKPVTALFNREAATLHPARI